MRRLQSDQAVGQEELASVQAFPGDRCDQALYAFTARNIDDLAARDPRQCAGRFVRRAQAAGVVNQENIGDRGTPDVATIVQHDRLICPGAGRLLARQREPSAFHAIVNVTSANAEAVAVPRSEYCASKAAAAMVSKTWAVRLGPENIAVYDVRPGLIDTDMTAPVIEQYAERARAGLTLLPRVGKPGEVGEIIATLAAGRLPYTTGQVIAADAGMLVSRF